MDCEGIKLVFEELVLCLSLVDELGELLILVEEVSVVLQNEIDLLLEFIDFLDFASQGSILLGKYIDLLLQAASIVWHGVFPRIYPRSKGTSGIGSHR